MGIITVDDLQRVKNYLHIDSNYEDDMIKTNIATARSFLKNGIGPYVFDYAEDLEDDDKELFNTIILLYVEQLYSTPNNFSQKYMFNPMGLQALILQVKAGYLLYEKGVLSSESNTTE